MCTKRRHRRHRAEGWPADRRFRVAFNVWAVAVRAADRRRDMTAVRDRQRAVVCRTWHDWRLATLYSARVRLALHGWWAVGLIHRQRQRRAWAGWRRWHGECHRQSELSAAAVSFAAAQPTGRRRVAALRLGLARWLAYCNVVIGRRTAEALADQYHWQHVRVCSAGWVLRTWRWKTSFAQLSRTAASTALAHYHMLRSKEVFSRWADAVRRRFRRRAVRSTPTNRLAQLRVDIMSEPLTALLPLTGTL